MRASFIVVMCLTLGACAGNKQTTMSASQEPGTCKRTCSRYASCATMDQSSKYDLCLRECPTAFSKGPALRHLSSLSCRKILEYIEGSESPELTKIDAYERAFSFSPDDEEALRRAFEQRRASK